MANIQFTVVGNIHHGNGDVLMRIGNRQNPTTRIIRKCRHPVRALKRFAQTVELILEIKPALIDAVIQPAQ
jgi:hypothetical protein